VRRHFPWSTSFSLAEMVVLSPAGRQVKAGEGEIRSIVKGTVD
jgi:hypothetical protein